MAGYGKKAQAMVKEAVEKIKDGALKRGKSGKKPTGRRQAALSDARKEGPRYLCRPKTSTPFT
jgi:hypothetical protein